MRPKTKIAIAGFGSVILAIAWSSIYYLPLAKENNATSNSIISEKTKEKLTVEQELIWEKKFDSEIVNFVIPRMPKIRKPNEFPIVAVATLEKLIFFDNKGRVKREILLPRDAPVDYISIADNGEFFLVPRIVEEFEYDYEFFNQEGKKLWELNRIYGGYEMSPFGNIVVILPEEVMVEEEDGMEEEDKWELYGGGIQFYNKKGKKIKEYNSKLYSGDSGGFSGDERFYCHNFSDKPSSPMKKEFIILFDRNGKILWKYFFDDRGWEEKILISLHGEVISLLRYTLGEEASDYIYTLNNRGKLLWKRERKMIYAQDRSEIISQVENIAISSNGKYLLAIVTDSISFFENLTGRELFSIKLPNIREAWISPDGNLIFAIQRGEKETLFIINKSGEIVSKQCIDFSLRGVKFSNGIIYLIYYEGDTKLSVYKLKLKKENI